MPFFSLVVVLQFVIFFSFDVQSVVKPLSFPESILYKSTAGRYRPVRVADGPITARCRFIKNASWVVSRFHHTELVSLLSPTPPHRHRLFEEKRGDMIFGFQWLVMRSA